METYVVGDFKSSVRDKADRLEQLAANLDDVGYEFNIRGSLDSFAFRKLGHIEAVITELVPVCERYGLDVEEFELKEYRVDNHSLRSVYRDGRVIRDLQHAPV